MAIQNSYVEVYFCHILVNILVPIKLKIKPLFWLDAHLQAVGRIDGKRSDLTRQLSIDKRCDTHQVCLESWRLLLWSCSYFQWGCVLQRRLKKKKKNHTWTKYRTQRIQYQEHKVRWRNLNYWLNIFHYFC